MAYFMTISVLSEILDDSVQRSGMVWTAGIRFPARQRDFSQLHNVQTGSGAQPLSYKMGILVSFSGG
jgi:hypothetical protein